MAPTRSIPIGSFVHVSPPLNSHKRSGGNVGWIRKKKKRKFDENGGVVSTLTQDSAAASTMSGVSLYDVKYSIENRMSQDVVRERIDIATMAIPARRRGPNEEERPSILSTSHRPSSTAAAPTEESTNPDTYTKYSYQWLMTNQSRKHRNTPMIPYCLERKLTTDTSGWLRRLDGFTSKQTDPLEKKRAMDLYNACTGFESRTKMVAHAYGVSSQSIRDWHKAMIANNGSLQRQKRADAGKTLINSAKKRASIFTAKTVFAKDLRAKSEAKVSKEAVSEAWNAASPRTKRAYEKTAAEWKQIGPFLVEEIKQKLFSTSGTCSWEALATLVSGSGNTQIVSANTIRSFVMNLPNSSYQSTTILPKLDAANKKRRYLWSLEFWFFWDSAKRFHSSVQVLLVHMDEKWFWTIVVRRNLKSVPFFGIEPVQHGVQHKSHLGKTMAIASTAFAPTNNDMTRGGTAYTVSLTRVGKMMPAEQDTYKRVYRDDGTYHYPKIPENRLRRKGELYFRNLEVTGSKEKVDKKPKFSLLKWFLEVELVRLEQLAQQIGTETGKRVVVRYQMDGAGPHNDALLQSQLNVEFEARGWMLKKQPSNSPVTNTNDDYVFPMMSKDVSREQGVSKGSQVFSPEELWSAVQKSWNRLPMEKIARAYVRHAQIASAIASCKGGDDFVRERNGLHCNVRKMCVTVCDNNGQPIGVEVLTSYENPDSDGDDAGRPEFRYPKPPPDPTALRRLNQQEIYALFDNLPVSDTLFEAVTEVYNESMVGTTSGSAPSASV